MFNLIAVISLLPASAIGGIGYQSDQSNDATYMSVDAAMTPPPQQWTVTGQDVSQNGGVGNAMNIPFSSEQVVAPMTSVASEHMNIPPLGGGGDQQVFKTENKLPPVSTAGGPELVQLGDNTKLFSLSAIDMGMSLPSLPSIGEEFPGVGNTVQLAAVDMVAAEETVQSSEAPPTSGAAAQPEVKRSPGGSGVPVSAAVSAAVNMPTEQSLSLASLDRRIGESNELLRSLQKNNN